MVKVNQRYSEALVQWSRFERFPVSMEPREMGVLYTFIEHLKAEADKKDMIFEGFLHLHMAVGCMPFQKYKAVADYCDVIKILHGIEHECQTERLIALYSPKV